jgi:GR25 family glycosyltransferase involved in LPS biosynthesis
MNNYVITIMDNPRSVEVAQRCIDSGMSTGNIHIQMFEAITPQSNLTELMRREGISPYNFEEKYSRQHNCMAAFMSHYSLWKLSAETNEEITIFEHDAFIMAPIPEFIPHLGCISLGTPSYGRWNTPQHFGVNPLVSKGYFPGAHAYRVKPHIAQLLIDSAKVFAQPTDLFLNKDRFSFLEEYYPWPVIARDSFTTIQNDLGIQAKHSYVKIGDKYEIL